MSGSASLSLLHLFIVHRSSDGAAPCPLKAALRRTEALQLACSIAVPGGCIGIVWKCASLSVEKAFLLCLMRGGSVEFVHPRPYRDVYKDLIATSRGIS
eukprot:scaffold12745_cov109-Skeletonema_dohrnii-CCMP3373.AAC.2